VKFPKILNKDNKLHLLYEYSDFHLDRMSPDFYNLSDIGQESNILTIETMMLHKDLYDEALLMTITKSPTNDSIISFLDKMISHYENSEEFEYCSYLKNTQSTI